MKVNIKFINESSEEGRFDVSAAIDGTNRRAVGVGYPVLADIISGEKLRVLLTEGKAWKSDGIIISEDEWKKIVFEQKF